MKARLGIALTVLALAAPVAAYASTVVTRPGADTSKIDANGCRVVKNADHSITVSCSGADWAKLQWSFVGRSKLTITIASAHSRKYQPTVTASRIHQVGGGLYSYEVTQLVHDNTIRSVTATFG